MFWIVILLEAMACWVILANKRNQGIFQQLCIHRSVHFALKDTDSCSSSPAYSSPHMHFYGMLRSWFVPWSLSPFPATEAPVSFHLHSGFIRPDYMVEIVVAVFQGPSKTLAFVLFPYHLAVRSTAIVPA